MPSRAFRSTPLSSSPHLIHTGNPGHSPQLHCLSNPLALVHEAGSPVLMISILPLRELKNRGNVTCLRLYNLESNQAKILTPNLVPLLQHPGPSPGIRTEWGPLRVFVPVSMPFPPRQEAVWPLVGYLQWRELTHTWGTEAA